MTLTEFNIGTYSDASLGGDANGEGIYRCAVDSETGAFSDLALAAECRNPSYVIRSADGKVLYAVSETLTGDNSSVLSFAVHGTHLDHVSTQPVNGDLPCHLALHPSGRWLATAQYGSGDASIFSLSEQGAIMPMALQIKGEGSGPNADRQKGPHAHFVQFLGDGHRLAIVDLGSDCVAFYDFDERPTGVHVEAAQIMRSEPGSGPRHIAIADDESILVLLSELDESVAVSLRENNIWRAVERVQTFTDVPLDGGSAAAIRFSPDEKHVYASFRRQSRIVGFDLERSTPYLNRMGDWPTGGTCPRDFAVTPDGHCVVMANQNSNQLTSALRDPVSGILTATSHTAEVGSPVCVCF